jgi:hypothetical protein
MVRKLPPENDVRGNSTLSLLALSFEQVRAMLKSRGFDMKADPGLLNTVSDALITKVHEGESSQEQLAEYAFLKAWVHIRRTEEMRAVQLDKLRKRFKKPPT